MPRRLSHFLLLLSLLPVPVLAQETPPRSLDPRVKIELFAEQPQIATPTGIDVDHRGRVWAIECNTHFPKPDYKGHPHDRVFVMSDTDGDGRADKSIVFVDGLRHAMSVVHRPAWYPVEGPHSRRVDEPQSKASPRPLSEIRNP